MNDCFVAPIQHFPALSWREQFNFQLDDDDYDDDDDDEARFVLDQQSELYLYSTSSLKQQSAGLHITPLEQIILIPSQLNLWSFSLMLRA